MNKNSVCSLNKKKWLTTHDFLTKEGQVKEKTLILPEEGSELHWQVLV